MGEFENKLAAAKKLRDDAELLHKQAEKKMQEAKQILGIEAGQTISTQNTLYYMLDLIKKRLLAKFKNVEDSLGIYGFRVVISTSSSPKRTPKTK